LRHLDSGAARNLPETGADRHRVSNRVIGHRRCGAVPELTHELDGDQRVMSDPVLNLPIEESAVWGTEEVEDEPLIGLTEIPH